MIITKKLTVDLMRRGIQETVEAVQCDANTRAVAVTLFCGDTPWNPPEGFTASVAFRKPDGRSGWYDKLPDGNAACSVAGNVVTAILAPEVLTVAGKVAVAVVFQNDNLDQLATFPFLVVASENPAAGGVISNNYYNLQNLGQINAAVEDLQRQLATIIDDTAVGDKAWSSKRITQAIGQVDGSCAIVCQATGQTICVSDAAERPLKNLTVYGKTTQNGTPTPQSPVPLESAGASGSIGVNVIGKNFIKRPYWDTSKTVNGITFTVNEDGTITANGTATAQAQFSVAVDSNTEGLYLPAGTFTLSGCPKGGGTGKYYLRSIGNTYGLQVDDFGEGATGTAIGGRSSTGIVIRIASGVTVNNLVFKPQIELGTAATAYEPYKEQTLTVATPVGLNGIDEVRDYIDFEKGVYVKHNLRFGANDILGYARQNGECDTDNRLMIACQIPYLKNYQMAKRKAKCNLFEHSNTTIQAAWVDKTAFHMHDDLQYSQYLYFKLEKSLFSALDDATVLAEFQEMIKDIEIVCNIPTPIETPLTAEQLSAFKALHSNKPHTTVTNDAGADMAVQYIADTKLYIDHKIAELQNAILSAGANV